MTVFVVMWTAMYSQPCLVILQACFPAEECRRLVQVHYLY